MEMKMKRVTILTSLLCLCFPALTMAQKTANVTGKYTFEVGDNDNISLSEAKRKCITMAQAEAIKAEFGELVSSETFSSNTASGETSNSSFWENTMASAKGDWLGNTREPQLDVEFRDGKLVFTAEVWGKAREVTRAPMDLQWEVLRGAMKVVQNGSRIEREETSREPSEVFNSKDRLFVSFKAPIDCYVAIYMMESDGKTTCMLPMTSSEGCFKVKGGRQYTFFDKDYDYNPSYLTMSTNEAQEVNQLYIICSTNPFVKCVGTTESKNKLSSVSTADFQKWLYKNMRSDSQLEMKTKWLTIKNNSAANN